MEYQDILYSVDGGLAVITLNRPDKLNAFTASMLAELRTAVAGAAADPSVRAVTLTGAGRGFCAGQDLNDRSVAPGEKMPDLGITLDTNYNPVVRALRSMPKPVIVGLNGVAAGAGANIALAGDIVIGRRSAKFLQPFSNLGLVPDAGGTYFLPRLIGLARAFGLAYLAEAITAEQAAEWGLIWKAVDDDAFEDELRSVGEKLAAGPTGGYARTKAAFNVSFANSLDAQLDVERDMQSECSQSDDYREGVTAFLEKRPPRFTGQ